MDQKMVRIPVHMECGTQSEIEYVQIPLAAWNAMTPEERQKELDDQAETLFWNFANYGSDISNAEIPED